MLNYKNKEYICHLDLAMDIIKGKWKAVLICHLKEGPKRFLELQRITGNISQKVLNEKLVEMQEQGVVLKTVYPQVPPHVEFSLTEKGQELSSAIDQLEVWASKYYRNVEKINKKT